MGDTEEEVEEEEEEEDNSLIDKYSRPPIYVLI